jgi:hypothetical protein
MKKTKNTRKISTGKSIPRVEPAEGCPACKRINLLIKFE